FESVNDQVVVTWRARGSKKPQTMVVDRVVNCTGPDYNIRRSRDPLTCSLLAQGLAAPDPNNLGIRTGSYGALIDSHGRAATNLFYVGPMLRADHWEATAAHELRGHAEQLASYLAAPVGRSHLSASAPVARLQAANLNPPPAVDPEGVSRQPSAPTRGPRSPGRRPSSRDHRTRERRALQAPGAPNPIGPPAGPSARRLI